MSWELNEGFSPIIHACNLQLSLIHHGALQAHAQENHSAAAQR